MTTPHTNQKTFLFFLKGGNDIGEYYKAEACSHSLSINNIPLGILFSKIWKKDNFLELSKICKIIHSYGKKYFMCPLCLLISKLI